MWRQIPNIITTLRLVLAAAFFVFLSFYQYERRGDPWLMCFAFAVYILALVSDWLDGYLARRWHVPSAFGRVVDPFADKILVLGSFIFFAGKNFLIPESGLKTITGVAPWMVVVLLSRELLVTSLRGISEASGQSFAAVWAGKFKMGFQSGTILVILIYVAFLHELIDHHWEHPMLILRNFGIWGTLVITIYSGWAYIRRAVDLFQSAERPAA